MLSTIKHTAQCLLAGLAVVGCTYESLEAPTTEQIFTTPPASTDFGRADGTVMLSKMQGHAACYTINGDAPTVVDGVCQGESQPYEQKHGIFLFCDGEYNVVHRRIQLAFEWPNPNNDVIEVHHREATYSLDCGVYVPPPDGDADGVPDLSDNCPEMANPEQSDQDDDGQGNVCDTDHDNDGVSNDTDNCPLVGNADQGDYDHDGQGNACDNFTDFDADTVEDGIDNCPFANNPDQADLDRDGDGDACDGQNDDPDADGVLSAVDNCPLLANPDQADLDTDAIGDVCDSFSDIDHDLLADAADNCPQTANNGQEDSDQDGRGNACDSTPRGHDSDNDGIPALDDNCPLEANPGQIDSNGNGVGDACEPDNEIPVVTHLNNTEAPAQLTAQQDCLAEVSGGTSVSDLNENNMQAYVNCLSARGASFDALSGAYVANVRNHCFNAVDPYYVGGIGGDGYRAYLRCFEERGINPSRLTVDAAYAAKVQTHCWGDRTTEDEFMSWSLILWTSVSNPYNSMSRVVTVINTAYMILELADTAMDVHDYIQDHGKLTFFNLNPRSLENPVAYKACLKDRNIPGWNFKPFHDGNAEQKSAWYDLVQDYCLQTVIETAGIYGSYWQASELRKCYQDRDYPEAGYDNPAVIFGDFKPINDAIYDYTYSDCNQRYSRTTQTGDYIACFGRHGVTMKPEQLAALEANLKTQCATSYPAGSRGQNANAYRDCIEKPGFALSAAEEATLAAAITTYCDNSNYVTSRYANYAPYWACYTERRTTFSNNANWQTGVRSYCADSNLVVYKKSGYDQCLLERKVSDDGSYWRSRVKTYCDGSNYGTSRYANYSPYWACFTERGTTYVNDGNWQSGVREYCAGSNMGVGLLSGYNTCLNQRQVSDDGSYWRSRVKTHCDGSNYGTSRYANYSPYWGCFTERGTTFINDADWQRGVRSYCGDSNVQYNKLSGHKTCLNERKVSYDQPTWCATVKTYCDAQIYIIDSAKTTCFTERGCTRY